MSELDELDLRILQQLQVDASLNNQELADKVHASAPTCLRRVKRLMNEGVIEKQVAILSPRHLGMGLTALVEVSLDRQNSEALDEFEKLCLLESCVMQCYRISSGPDFMLVVQVSDMASYHAFAHRFLSMHKNVRNVRCFFSQHRAKFETRLTLPTANLHSK